MQLMDAIVERRAVREYEDAVVDWRQLKEIINAAILAPSARNRQPWAFARATQGRSRRRVCPPSEKLAALDFRRGSC